MVSDNAVIGTQEAARQLGVSVRTVQLWVERGILDAWKTPGGHRRISLQSVERALASRQSGVGNADAGLRILVVEDDATMQSYYRALLDVLRPEAELVVASDGYEGLIELGRQSPQLMLVDVDMPGMDGLAMLRRLGSGNLGEGVRIAIVSGLGKDEIDARGGAPDGIPVFKKPLGVDELGELLSAAMPADESEAR